MWETGGCDAARPSSFLMDGEQLLSGSFRNCSIVETAFGCQRYDIIGCLTHGLHEASKHMRAIPHSWIRSIRVGLCDNFGFRGEGWLKVWMKDG